MPTVLHVSVGRFYSVQFTLHTHTLLHSAFILLFYYYIHTGWCNKTWPMAIVSKKCAKYFTRNCVNCNMDDLITNLPPSLKMKTFKNRSAFHKVKCTSTPKPNFLALASSPAFVPPIKHFTSKRTDKSTLRTVKTDVDNAT